jgi:hypothetical protein
MNKYPMQAPSFGQAICNMLLRSGNGFVWYNGHIENLYESFEFNQDLFNLDDISFSNIEQYFRDGYEYCNFFNITEVDENWIEIVICVYKAIKRFINITTNKEWYPKQYDIANNILEKFKNTEFFKFMVESEEIKLHEELKKYSVNVIV